MGVICIEKVDGNSRNSNSNSNKAGLNPKQRSYGPRPVKKIQNGLGPLKKTSTGPTGPVNIWGHSCKLVSLQECAKCF